VRSAAIVVLETIKGRANYLASRPRSQRTRVSKKGLGTHKNDVTMAAYMKQEEELLVPEPKSPETERKHVSHAARPGRKRAASATTRVFG
jgi:hypothetical protein